MSIWIWHHFRRVKMVFFEAAGIRQWCWKFWLLQLLWERSGVDPASLTRLTGLNKSTYSEHVAICFFPKWIFHRTRHIRKPTFMRTQQIVLVVSVEESKKPCDIFYHYFFFSSKYIIGAINWILFRHLNQLTYYNISVLMFSWWKC